MSYVSVVYFDLGDTLIASGEWVRGARELLARAKISGLRLGLISNVGQLTREQLRDHLPGDFLFTAFEAQLVLLSSEVGLEKPDPRLFTLAIERAGVSPAECLFVTEELSHCLAAQSLGLRTARVRAGDPHDLGGLLGALVSVGLLNASGLVGPDDCVEEGREGGVSVEHAVPIPSSQLLADVGPQADAAVYAIALEAPVAAPTARQVADAYLALRGPALGLAKGFAHSALEVAGEAGLSPTDRLAFAREKQVGGTVVVCYQHMIDEAPVLGATFAVRLNTALDVTSSFSSIPPKVVQVEGAADQDLQLDELPALLGLGSSAGLRLHEQRPAIYRYDSSARVEESHGDHSSPELPLPPTDARVVEGSYRRAREVFFALPRDGWGEINWKAVVDSETRSVLMLRPGVSGVATGEVFRLDPVTTTGQDLNAGSELALLNAAREEVSLEGLGQINGADEQELSGEFVSLVDLASPLSPPPRTTAPFAFAFSAETMDFAAVNAYYHCDRLYRFTQELGIDVPTFFGGTSFPVPVDHRGEAGARNAHAYGNATHTGMGRFTFGLLQNGENLGIATAGRVVWHEFGHALLWDHVGSPNFGFAHSPGDALGAILSDVDTRAPDRFATFPFTGLTTRRHDRSWTWHGPNYNSGYKGEQVLSTTLFRAYRALGGDSSQRSQREFAAHHCAYLIISAVGLLSATTSDPRVYVGALREADRNTPDFRGQPGGATVKVMRWAFEKQGLYAGQSPAVDVFIDDGRAGEYEWRSNTTGPRGLWNRVEADGGEAHQAPKPGAPNALYVRVQNRGTSPAYGVEVRLHAGPAEGNWPDDFSEIAAATAPGSLAPDAAVVVGPIEWTPEGQAACVAVVSASGDAPIQVSQGRSISAEKLARWDNNVALRVLEG